MTASQILSNLRVRDIVVTLNGDRLKINAPAGALTDEDRDQLRERKAELLELLASPEHDPGADENTEMHNSMILDDGTVEVCPICAGELREQHGKHFRHIWCPNPGHFDAWRAPVGGKLSNSDAPIVRGRVGRQ